MLGQGGLGLPNLAALSVVGGTSVLPALFGSQTFIFFPVMVLLPNVPIQPTLFVDPDVFRPPAIIRTGAGDVVVETFEDPDSFGTVLISQVLPLSNFVDPDQFFAPTIVLFGVQQIEPQRFVDPDVIQQITRVDTVLKFLTPFRYTNFQVFWGPTVQAISPDPVYNYPIGHSLDSDYGFQRSNQLTKERRVIGRH